VADDVCRALIVAPYVGEDLFGPLDVGWVCLEIERRRLGIALDRAPNGWFNSWATDADSAPAVAVRFK